MSYQPLARKYRPIKFSHLVGQETAALALKNSIRLKREPCAVIFSGIRGIGKTTTARIYAKALNCPHQDQGEPCGVCESCVAIALGSHEDVIEIDGASHNGVDEVRALQETISYVPQRSQYKVYMIDEVHMLSQSAFNALLKTLEEPPPHVIFIFATTELHKVPQTVVGRCQTFYLNKISTAQIQETLIKTLEQENIAFENEVVYLAAKQGHGSMRDALTFLDQLIALSDGPLKLQQVKELFPQVDTELFADLLKALVLRDGTQCIDIVQAFDQKGVDFTQIVEELIRLARGGFILASLPQTKPQELELSDHESKFLKELVTKASPFDFNRIFRTLISCLKELDGSIMDRWTFENYCIEWCFDPGLPVVEDALQNRPTKNFAPPKQPVAQPQVSASIRSEPAAQAQPPKQPAAQPQVIKTEFPQNWRELLDIWKTKKPLQARKLEEVYSLEFSPQKIVVAVEEDSMVAPMLLQSDVQKKIAAGFNEMFGFKGEFRAVKRTQDNEANQNETVLDQRTKEKKEKRDQLYQDAINHPATNQVVKEFQGTITNVRLPGDP